MMNKTIYWDAPLWQLVIAILTLITAFSIQHWLLWRKPSLREAIHDTDTNLTTLPLFFFSEFAGLLPLSDAAYAFLKKNNIEKNNHMRLLMTLLKQALNTNEIIIRNDDTIDPLSLITIPHFNPKTKQGGVLAVITEHTTLFTTHDAQIDDSLLAEHVLHDWVQIDGNLMVHLLARQIQIKQGDQWIEKQPTQLQQELLRYFIRHVGQPISYQDIFKHTWIDEQVQHPGLTQNQRDKLRSQIYQIRQLIEQNPSKPQKINTIHNYGYTFQAKIESIKTTGDIDA